MHHHCTISPMEQSALTKKEAFQAMDQLEGWCPKSKASIMMDMILLLKPKVVVEIGVFGGKSLVPMAYACRANNQGKVIGIDPWLTKESMVGMDGVNLEWWGQVDHEMIMHGLEHRIDQFGLNNYIQLIQTTSHDAEPIMNIDILHIDGNHSEETSCIDVYKWVPLVRTGGIIIFDDINWATTAKAVAYLNEHCTHLSNFTGDNVWGIWVKK